MEKKNSNKNIILVVVILIIIGAIWYIEVQKPVASTSSGISLVTTIGGSASSTAPAGAVPSTASSSVSAAAATAVRISSKSALYPPAKELAGIQGYINTPPFTLASLVGQKVILIDFWTYSCINCQRTIPYLNAWYKKYKDYGLVIVGVHTPEFDFEKNYTNVANAVKQAGIQYPVVLDSNQGTWDAYQNLYWPHEYLIDIDGFIVHDHIGEGAYDETEQAIQSALKERAEVLGSSTSAIPTGIVSPADVISMNADQVQSPETYFGSARNEYLGNGKVSVSGPQTLTLPSEAFTQPNTLYLGGTWNFQNEFAESTGATSDIVFNYNAKNVYFVASASAAASASGGVKIKIFRDGQLLTGPEAGADVGPDGTATINADRLYSLIKGSDYGQHTLHIEVEGAGLDAYTFTFG